LMIYLSIWWRSGNQHKALYDDQICSYSLGLEKYRPDNCHYFSIRDYAFLNGRRLSSRLAPVTVDQLPLAFLLMI